MKTAQNCRQHTLRTLRRAAPGFPSAGYNRVLRVLCASLLIVCLTACKREPDNAAIRQGVIDRLTNAGMNVAAMDVSIQSLQIQGKDADVTVEIKLKGAPEAQPMIMRYRMQQQDDRWVVLAAPGGGGNPHGVGAAPDMPNPHGGGKMPSPEDLPPAGKQK